MTNETRSRCYIKETGFDKLSSLPVIKDNHYGPALIKLKEDTGLNIETLEKMLGKHKLGQINIKAPVQLRKIQQLFSHYGLTLNKEDWGHANDESESEESSERDDDIHIYELVKLFRSQIEQQIKDSCGNIKLLTMLKPVVIDDIYVDLKIFGEKEPNRITTSKFQVEAERDKLRILITAEIGGGKTTFLKNLAFQCIQGKFLLDQLPLHLILREYIEQQKSQDLLDFIANKYSLDKLNLEKILKYEKKDQCLLLFDGLDQVEENDRDYLISQIKDFIQKYPKNDYIISCRQFPQKGLLENFEELKLAKLDKSLKKEFIEKRLKAILKSTSQEDNTKSNNLKLINELINYLDENVNISQLCENPLMLALICLEFINRGEDCLNLSETKWAIIREAVAIWLEKWNIEQGWEAQKAYDTYFVENLLSFIAYKTFKDSYLYLSKERLIKYIREFIDYEHKVDVSHQLYVHAENIFQALVDIYGITLAIGSDFYSFPHIIFRNYFAILYIGRKYQSIDEFEQKLADTATIEDKSSNNWKELLKDADEAYNFLFGGKIKLDVAGN